MGDADSSPVRLLFLVQRASTPARGRLLLFFLAFGAVPFFQPDPPALAQGLSPSVVLTLNSSRFETAQTLKVGLTAQNPAGHSAAVLYVGFLLPDRQTFVILGPTGPVVLSGPRLSQIPPWQSAPPGFIVDQPSFLQFTFPATGVPRGIYQAFAALVRPGALEDNSINPGDILAFDVKPFRFLLPTRGLYALAVERRGAPSGYHAGQLIRGWTTFDSVVGHTAGEEAALQLDIMRAMGVNTITFELRTADDFCNETNPDCTPPPFPQCLISGGTGLLWPRPTSTELANLRLFFDLVQTKGMRVLLRLTNTHMEERPPTNAQAWLGAILGVVKDHPALDLVLFEGDTHLIDTDGDGTLDACGGQAEPPLYLGPRSVPVQYVKWAIDFARSLGIPTKKLSAEAIIGNFFIESQPPAGPDATDRHLWSPIAVLKKVFDELGIPDSKRTYAVSFYEAFKCATAQSLPCTDTDPHTWADQTLRLVLATIGPGKGARVVSPEMGVLQPTSPSWPADKALASLISLFEKYGLDGGAYWKWVAVDSADDADRTIVKRRGIDFIYNPVQREVLHMGGFP